MRTAIVGVVISGPKAEYVVGAAPSDIILALPLIDPVPSLRIAAGAELGNWMLTFRQFGKRDWFDPKSKSSGIDTGA